MTDANPDRACPHENFDAYVDVARRTKSDTDPTVVGYTAEIRVTCRDCQEPFRWTGLQAGLSSARPMCSVDETELLAPLRPASADPDFGLGLPGYAVTWRPGPAADGTSAFIDETCLNFSEHGWGRCVEPRDHAPGKHMYRNPKLS